MNAQQQQLPVAAETMLTAKTGVAVRHDEAIVRTSETKSPVHETQAVDRQEKWGKSERERKKENCVRQNFGLEVIGITFNRSQSFDPLTQSPSLPLLLTALTHIVPKVKQKLHTYAECEKETRESNVRVRYRNEPVSECSCSV